MIVGRAFRPGRLVAAAIAELLTSDPATDQAAAAAMIRARTLAPGRGNRVDHPARPDRCPPPRGPGVDPAPDRTFTTVGDGTIRHRLIFCSPAGEGTGVGPRRIDYRLKRFNSVLQSVLNQFQVVQFVLVSIRPDSLLGVVGGTSDSQTGAVTESFGPLAALVGQRVAVGALTRTTGASPFRHVSQ